MRRTLLGLGLLVLLGYGPGLADTVYYRCVEAGGTAERTDPREVMTVTIDPLLGEMKAERYSSKTFQSRTIYRIEQMDETTIRGRNVGQRGAVVMELNRVASRVTETIGGNEPTYYDCEPPRSVL